MTHDRIAADAARGLEKIEQALDELIVRSPPARAEQAKCPPHVATSVSIRFVNDFIGYGEVGLSAKCMICGVELIACLEPQEWIECYD